MLLSLGLLAAMLLGPVLWVRAGAWEHTSHGPGGGSIQALAFDGNYLYAGTYRGWVYRWKTAGSDLEWVLKKGTIYVIPDSNQARDILSLAVDGSANVYAGTNGAGVYESMDQGDNWRSLGTTGLGNLVVRSLVISPTSSAIVYAGTDAGVYSGTVSAPFTVSWSKMGVLNCTTRALAVASGRLYAGCEGGNVYYWDGNAWQAMAGLPGGVPVRALQADGNILYAGTGGSGVYSCTVTLTTTWYAQGSLPPGDARDVRSLTVDNHTLYAGTEAGIYRWSGTQWEPRSGDLETGEAYSNAHHIHALIRTNANTLYAGTPGRGVFRTADGGGAWTVANGIPSGSVLSAQVVRAVAVNPAYDWRIYAGTVGGGIQRSPDGGLTWVRRSTGIEDRDVFALAVTHPSGVPVYAGTNDGIFTTTTGLTWTLASNGISMTQGSYVDVHALVIDPVSTTIVYAGTTNGIFKTMNAGSLWAYKCVSCSLPADVNIFSLAIDPVTPTIVYAGTEAQGVYRSTDAGEHWLPFNAGLNCDGCVLQEIPHYINALAVDSDHHVFAGIEAGLSSGVYVNITGTWSYDPPEGLPLPGRPPQALVVNPITSTLVVLGTAGDGVYINDNPSPDSKWLERNSNLQNRYVYALAVDDYFTQTMHAGTYGSSVWDYTWGPPPSPPPELGVSKSDGLAEVSLGQLVTYTIGYVNNGDATATGVVITDVIPTYTVYVSSNPGFTHVAGQVYKLSVSSVLSNSSSAAQFVVRVLTNPVGAPAALLNTVTIGDDGSNGADPFEDNNRGTDLTDLNWVDLQVSKSHGLTQVNQGDVVTYTIAYTNAGRAAADNVVLTEIFTGQATYTGTGWTPLGGNRYSKSVGTVANSGGSGAATFTVRVNDDATGTLVNRVEISYDGAHGPDITPGDNAYQKEDFIGVVPPNLQVSKTDGVETVTPGDTITYTITYTNSGALAQGIVVTETLPDRTTFQGDAGWHLVSGRTYTRTVPNLAGGGTASVNIVARVDDNASAGPITNTVSINAMAQTSERMATDIDTVVLPDLVVSKTDGTYYITPGDIVTYTIAYTNTGAGVARGTVITETLPDRTTFQGDVGWHLVSGRTYTRTVDNLPSGGTASVNIVARVDDNASAGPITNTVSINAMAQTSERTATDIDSVVLPDLVVSKTDGTYYITPGDIVTYTIAYTNTGAGVARGIVITETLPDRTSFQGDAGWHLVSGRTYTCTVPNLAGGGTASVNIVARVDDNASAGPITNTVSINAMAQTSERAATDIDSVVLPDLVVSKTDGTYYIRHGDIITYTIAYTNTGAGVARGIVITETLPQHTAIQNNLGWQPVDTQTFTRTVPDLFAGQAAFASISVQVDPGMSAGFITNTVSVRTIGEADFSRNTATDTDYVLERTPDLVFTSFSDGVTATMLCQPLTYTMQCANTGDRDATGVVITATLPSGASYKGGGWASLGGNQYSRTVGSLAQGASAQITLTMVLTPTSVGQAFAVGRDGEGPTALGLAAEPSWPSTFTVRALVSCVEPEDQSNNTAEDTDTLLRPDLYVVSVTSVPTQPLRNKATALRVVIGNAGDAPVANDCCHGFYVDVYVNPAQRPAAGDYSNVGLSTWIGNVGVHGTQTLTFTYTFTATGTFTLYVQANPDRFGVIPEFNFGNNTSDPLLVTVSSPTPPKLYLPLVKKQSIL